MYRLQNKKIDLIFEKDGKEVLKKTLTNRLLDNYLDYILFYMLPRATGNALFPQFTNDESKPNLKMFPWAYVASTSDNTITDASTDMLYEYASQNIRVTETTGDKSKIITTNYDFGVLDFSFETPIKSVGFGRPAPLIGIDDFLLAFLDVEEQEIVVQAGLSFRMVRVDELITNETAKELYINGVLQPFVDYRYLPSNSEKRISQTELKKIYLCGEVGLEEICGSYDLDDLSLVRTNEGEITISGLPNYYIEEDILYPDEDVYPEVIFLSDIRAGNLQMAPDFGIINDRYAASYEFAVTFADYHYIGQQFIQEYLGETLYLEVDELDEFNGWVFFKEIPEITVNAFPTQPYRAIRSIGFEYEGSIFDVDTLATETFKVLTYVDLPELGTEFSDKELKIKWKCERG